MTVKRGRKGRPHWTHYRIAPNHPRFEAIIGNLLAEHQNELDLDELVIYHRHTDTFWNWCEHTVAQLGARVVHDIRFNSSAFQLDDDATLVAFTLRWAGEP
jgi:hypothetical protein